MSLPDLNYELELWEKGFLVIGVDEVGRGAFAGPIYAAGVIFAPTNNEKRITKLLSYGINDSKKLKPRERQKLAKIIQKEALAYYVSSIDVAEINRIGIGRANFLVMKNVVKNLLNSELRTQNSKLFVLVDGLKTKKLGRVQQKSIVGGDGISLSIAAASILAKVARDTHMKKLASEYSEYHWGKNKGYGTLFHRQVLSRLGATPFHRTDFVENFI